MNLTFQVKNYDILLKSGGTITNQQSIIGYPITNSSMMFKVEQNNYPATELSRNEAITHQPVTVEVVIAT